MSHLQFKGVIPAVPTAFKNGQIDLESIEKLSDHLIKSGVHALSPCGTTGEGSTLSDEEFLSVVQRVVSISRSRVPVIPGTGAIDVRHAILRTKMAKDAGAAAALVVTPYYVKPSQEGLIRFYEALSKACDLPLIIYNVPSRTSVSASPQTLASICQVANVVGIKECASLSQALELLRLVPKHVAVLTGEDPLYFPFLACGGHGIISVVANLYPEAWVNIWDANQAGEIQTARDLFLDLRIWTDALFYESNPVPLKYMLSKKAWMKNEVRLPLTICSSQVREKLDALERA